MWLAHSGPMASIVTTKANRAARRQAMLGNGKALLRNFVEKASVPTFLVQLDGILAYANHAGSDLLGYSNDEWIGADFSTFVHPDDLTTARGQIEALLSGTIPSFQ